jgi:uncharacterized protein (TIGR03067 family)
MVMVVAVSLLGVPDKPPKKKDPAKAEMKKLEGSWTLTAYEYRVRQYPPERLPQLNMSLVIKGNEFALTIRQRTTARTFKIDPKKKPKTIDLTWTDGPQKGRTIPAIYMLDGDTLKICQATTGNKRPTEFHTKVGAPEVMYTFKKAKP